MTTVYVASASKDLAKNYKDCSVVKLMNSFRKLGHIIQFDWPRYMIEVEQSQTEQDKEVQQKGMQGCMQGVIDAEVVVFYGTKNFPSTGSIMEYMLAIEHKKRIAIVEGPDCNIEAFTQFSLHPFSLLAETEQKQVLTNSFVDYMHLLSFIGTENLSKDKAFKLFCKLD